ncbi:MAG: hypothetical protein KAX47_01585 [Zoogloea sp.]|jgi:hypothetical protein|nr:hypothetical protein [Zoogloea sp.]
MAVNRQPKGFRDSFTSSAQAQKDLRTRTEEGLSQRRTSGIILNPNEVAGEYDATRLLMTTLGGSFRAITAEDLVQFRINARKLGAKFKGGITAKQVIDLSTADRRKRTAEQIRTAAPILNKGGTVKFQTSAGPDSSRTRHYVTVDFLNYQPAVSSPVAPAKIAPEVLKGLVRIECDCEDWRYRYRYMASVGKYAAGPWYETGYPKITNTGLKGAGCKHILRVMTMIVQSPTMRSYVAKMVEKARGDVIPAKVTEKLADMEEFVKQQQKESHRQRRVITSEEKRAERARWATRSALATASNAAKAPKKAASQGRRAQRAAETLGARFGLTPAQVLALLAAQGQAG